MTSTGLELRYEDYLEWHEVARRSIFDPALSIAIRLIEDLLDQNIDEVDRGRFRISTSRVKSAQRSFAKLNREKYQHQFVGFDTIPDILDDFVGVRLVCNNLSDINRLKEVFGELPVQDGSIGGLAVEEDSQRDYFSNPKPSGYRAYHLNLVVPVTQMNGSRGVRVEIQARTLLQDGWGELTHEDTYKPGSTVPDWIVGMSLRMAELLAAVDNIAQDLRTGLDVEAQLSVEAESTDSDFAGVIEETADSMPTLPAQTDHVKSLPSQLLLDVSPELDSSLEIVLVNETRRLVNELSKPTALALLSQRLTAVLGTEITQSWSRFGGFKKFLETVVPYSHLSGPAPGYIHPPHTPIPEGWTTEDTGTGATPEVVRELRTYDKAIPLIGSERLDHVITAVSEVLANAAPYRSGGNATLAQIEEYAREARSIAEKQNHLVVRPHATYVLQVISKAGRVSSNLSDSEIRDLLRRHIMLLAISKGVVESGDRETTRELNEWLGIEQ